MNPKLTAKIVAPGEPSVTVTFSLDFPLSLLRQWERQSSLHSNVAEKFSHSIQNYSFFSAAADADLYAFLAEIN